MERLNDELTWGTALFDRRIVTATPARTQMYYPGPGTADIARPAVPLPTEMQVWPARWYLLGLPDAHNAMRADELLSVPVESSTLRAVEVEREGEVTEATFRFADGTQRVIRCSFAVGGNVLAYREEPIPGRSAGRDTLFHSGEFEWAEHRPGIFHLKKYEMRAGPSAVPDPAADRSFELSIEKFETVDGWPDDRFRLALPAGTRWQLRTADGSRRGTVGDAAPAGRPGPGVTQEALDALAEDAAGDGFGGGGR